MKKKVNYKVSWLNFVINHKLLKIYLKYFKCISLAIQDTKFFTKLKKKKRLGLLIKLSFLGLDWLVCLYQA